MTRVIDLIPASLEEPLLGFGLGFLGGWLFVFGITRLARARPAFAYSTGLLTLGVLASFLLSAWYRPHSFGLRSRYEFEIGISISLLAITLGFSHHVVRQPGHLFRGLGHLGGIWSTHWLALFAAQSLAYAALSDWQYGSHSAYFTMVMNVTMLLTPIISACFWFIIADRSVRHAIRQRMISQNNSAFEYDRSLWLPWLLAPMLVMAGPGILLGSIGLSITESFGELIQVLSLMLSGVLPVTGMLLGLRVQEHVPGHCGACGYSLRGLPDGKFITCPECGTVQRDALAPSPSGRGLG